MPSMSSQSALVVLFVTFGVFALLLFSIVVMSSVRQQRRHFRNRANFAGRLLAAQDKERAAIARELHDGVVHALIAIAASLRTRLGDDDLVKALDRSVESVRDLARGMHPSVLNHVDLRDALRDLAFYVTERQDFVVEFRCDSSRDNLSFDQRLALYRTAQEAISNAERHSQVRTATMLLQSTATGLTLSVSDHGIGFRPNIANTAAGLGLTSMRERMKLIGGSLTCDSALGRGTTITASVAQPDAR